MAATPLMLLAVAIDDERRSKEALRVSEERMSLAVESAQLALWDWDVANDRVWMTDEGRKFFGFAAGRTPSSTASLAGRVHPDDRAVRATAIQHALETGGSYEAEYRIILPDGSVRWIAARGRPSPAANDAPPRILGVSMDITRQKQADAEAQLQREELAHLSRVATLSALSGSLAHELSQPLSSILSNAQAGQRFMSQDAPDLVELRAIFADIVSADRRAGEIIERLRTMLRRGEVALQPVSVNESLEELLRLTRSDLIARGVSVSNLTTGDLPPAMTDRVQLQQVLLNLIVNACDAMESNPPEDRMLTLTPSSRRRDAHRRAGLRSRFAGRRRDLVPAVPHHQGWWLGHGPFDLPHAGDLAWREAVGGARDRARRRILCRAAAGQGERRGRLDYPRYRRRDLLADPRAPDDCVPDVNVVLQRSHIGDVAIPVRQRPNKRGYFFPSTTNSTDPCETRVYAYASDHRPDEYC